MKTKAYILTAEQAAEHQRCRKSFPICCILGVGLACMITLPASEGLKGEYPGILIFLVALMMIVWIGAMFAGMFQGFVHGRKLIGSVWSRVKFLAYIPPLWPILLFVFAILLLGFELAGIVVLAADIVMLATKRPLVYSKLEYEYIDDEKISG